MRRNAMMNMMNYYKATNSRDCYSDSKIIDLLDLIFRGPSIFAFSHTDDEALTSQMMPYEQIIEARLIMV